MRNFKLSEFDSPDAPGSGTLMDKQFLNLLDNIREAAGIPFRIDSGYRTEKRNEEVGGAKNSAHLRGLAVDIFAPSGHEKFIIVTSAIQHGITRIGIGKTFVHIDNDKSNPQEVIWPY